MKNVLKRWVDQFMTQDMFEQVKAVQRIAILGFILFAVALFYLAYFKISLTASDSKTLFELLLEKR